MVQPTPPMVTIDSHAETHLAESSACTACRRAYEAGTPRISLPLNGGILPTLSVRSPSAGTSVSTTSEATTTPISPASSIISEKAEALRKNNCYRLVSPLCFEAENHYYTRVLNAQLHWSVRAFFRMNLEQIIVRFCHLNPDVNEAGLRRVLSTPPEYLRWAGCDLICCTDATSSRKSMVVIETNSCPSGLKSTPLFEESDELGGYRRLLEHAFLPLLPEAERRVPGGHLAVLYDKNTMETWGYACALAQLANEDVHLVPFMMESAKSEGNRVRFVDGVLQVHAESGEWVNIRAALRYVTQRPWDRIPVDTRTVLLNPIAACLAGGRNKLVASKAYDDFNKRLEKDGVGVRILTPHTETDVPPEKIRERVEALGGFAVVKIPYSNAGQGVFTITCEEELAALEARLGISPSNNPAGNPSTITSQSNDGSAPDIPVSISERELTPTAPVCKYQRFIVQALIANHNWSSNIKGASALYHVGTMPTPKKRDIYVADLRMMVAGGKGGYKAVGMYGRKARKPLANKLEAGADSWSMLGTNLSVKVDEGLFASESERLILADCRDFDQMGLGIDDLIEGYVQTCLSISAVDHMCKTLMPDGIFSREKFEALNDDEGLLSEIMWAEKPVR